MEPDKIITKIEYGKRNNSRVNIYLNGEFALSILDELVYKKSLRVGDILDENLINELTDEDEVNKAKATAMRIVSKSQPSEYIIRKKLAEKYSDHAIEETMLVLKEYNIVDDNKLAHMMIRDGINLKKHGKNRIKSDMLKKGISSDLCESVLSEYDFSIDFENALYHAKKKRASKKNTNKNDLINDLSRYLQYRGFDFDTIKRVAQYLLDTENN